MFHFIDDEPMEDTEEVGGDGEDDEATEDTSMTDDEEPSDGDT